MKQHSVPQEIMSVEFNLFGSMNIRQFGYVAAAGAIGYLAYLILPGFLGWIGAGFCILLGLALAFAPGFDNMLTNFLLTLKRPTRRVWKKTPNPPDFMLDLPMKAYSAGHSLSAVSPETGDKGARVFSHLAKRDDEVETEVASVDKELERLQQEVLQRDDSQSEVETKLSVGVTDQPNVVNGQVLDSNGNPVAGAIVVVLDSLGKSIAAVKTNTQGIFISSKPLPLGKYSLNYVVDGAVIAATGVVANGAILPFVKLQAS